MWEISKSSWNVNWNVYRPATNIHSHIRENWVPASEKCLILEFLWAGLGVSNHCTKLFLDQLILSLILSFPASYFRAGLNDLNDLFQPKWFYDSVRLPGDHALFLLGAAQKISVGRETAPRGWDTHRVQIPAVMWRVVKPPSVPRLIISCLSNLLG